MLKTRDRKWRRCLAGRTTRLQSLGKRKHSTRSHVANNCLVFAQMYANLFKQNLACLKLTPPGNLRIVNRLPTQSVNRTCQIVLMKSGLVDELEKSENFYHFYWAFPRCLSFNWAICDRCHRRHQVNNYHGFTVKMINGGFVCCEQTATLCDWNNQKIPKLLRTSILKIILIIKRIAEDDLKHGWSSLALRGRHNARIFSFCSRHFSSLLRVFLSLEYRRPRRQLKDKKYSVMK